MTITWNNLAKIQKYNCWIISMLYKFCLTRLFQVGQNWLTWYTDRPQRALKQGLVFQVNVRSAIFTFKCSQRERNGRFYPVAHRNPSFFLFLCSQRERNAGFVPVANKRQLFLRAVSKTVAQYICFRGP